jgi:hypothetical protein
MNLRDVGRSLSIHHIYRTYISKKSLVANFVLLISNNIELVYGAAVLFAVFKSCEHYWISSWRPAV